MLNATKEAPVKAAEPVEIDPAVRARMQSIETRFQELDTLARQIPAIPANDDLSPELQNEIAEFTEQRSRVTDQFRKMVGPILAALSRVGTFNVENPAIADVHERVDVVRANRLINLEQAAKVASLGHDLAKRCAAELKPLYEKLDADLTETIAEVKSDLEKIGQGIEATVAGRLGANPATADRQLDYLSRQNVRSQQATTAAHNARVRWDACVQKIPKCQQQCEKIRTEMARIAVGEICI